jgi:hypothetical protein
MSHGQPLGSGSDRIGPIDIARFINGAIKVFDVDTQAQGDFDKLLLVDLA